MKWEQKAYIQNIIARFPSNLSYATYYFLQRKFGGLRSVNPISRFKAGIEIAQRIHQQDKSVVSKTFLEIGTGPQINLPIALWLLGASKIITVDLNPYLKTELIMSDINYIQHHQQEIAKLFERISSPVFTERFNELLKIENDIDSFFAITNIEYCAPADAANLHLASQSIDYHISFTTLEHIPPETIKHILHEGKRIVRPQGLFIHCVDFSDHFSHSDKSISVINFLKYDDKEWDRIAGNRYMYQNRLRVDDFIGLFKSADLQILSADSVINKNALEELQNGFLLSDRFSSKDSETIATSSAWIVAS